MDIMNEWNCTLCGIYWGLSLIHIYAWISGPNANKIEVVIANNDGMAMGAVESLKAQGKTAIPVFGVDALPEALAMVKSGAMRCV